MRAIIVMALFTVLIGLAGPAAAQQFRDQPNLGPEQIVAMTTHDFTNYMRDKTLRRLVDLCGVNTYGQYQCIKRNLIAGFDETGGAERHCFSHGTDLEQVQCVLTGAYGYSLAQSAGLESAKTFDWSDPDAELDEVMDELGTRIYDTCKKSASGPTGHCLVSELAHLLSLSDTQTGTCRAMPTLDKGMACAVHTRLLETIEAAMNRMGA